MAENFRQSIEYSCSLNPEDKKNLNIFWKLMKTSDKPYEYYFRNDWKELKKLLVKCRGREEQEVAEFLVTSCNTLEKQLKRKKQDDEFMFFMFYG